MWLEITAGPSKGTIVRVDSEPFIIGRGPDSQLRVVDHKVSRRHAALTFGETGILIIEDLSSENGTLVNSREIAEPTMLEDGAEVRLGDTVIRVSSTAPSGERRRSGAPILLGTLTTLLAVGALAFFFSDDLFPSGAQPTTTIRPKPTTTIPVTTPPTTTTATTGALSLADVVEAARPSTLKILTFDGDGAVLGSGSGWVYDEERGLIATNNHVISGGATFTLAGDGIMNGEQRQAVLVGAAPCEDLALIQISDPSGLVELQLGSQSELRAGDQVVAVGFPSDASLELPLAATAGIVSVVRTSLNEPDLFDVPHLTNVIRTDAAINPGNSGGPLLTLELSLVGVNTAGFTERNGRPIQNENYAIGVDRALEVLTRLETGESVGWVGVGLETFFDETGQGFLASTTVVPGSPADTAGLPSRLLIIDRIDGVRMDGTLQRYCDVVGSKTTGETAEFTFIDADSFDELVMEIPFG